MDDLRNPPGNGMALDDTDRALTALAETLPITVHRALGGWLVTIE